MEIDWLLFNGDKLLVKPNKAEEKTASGLFIPDTAKEVPSIGIIVAKSDEVISYEVEMEVMYGKNLGIPVVIADEDYVLLKSGEIYCEVRRPKQ